MSQPDGLTDNVGTGADGADEPHDERGGLDRGVARRHAFLKAAREVFLEFGFEAASVNEIVRRAGGSLATLYSQYGNKEGLFLAVAQDQNDRFVREILPACGDDLPLEEGLQVMGEQLLRAILTRDNLAFYRIVVGEGRKFPQLLQRYVATGAERIRGAIAAYVRARALKEGIEIPDPELTAAYFLDIVRSRHHYYSLANPAYTVTPAELTVHVRAAVQFFLHGALPRRD